jgi:lauroyl/myristoyl acyltransferase
LIAIHVAGTTQSLIRLENMEVPIRAHEKGKGILLLTNHFNNFEVSTVAGITQFPQYRGLFHFVRRPLKPRLLNELVTRRSRRAGFGVLSKRGSLDSILDLLERGAIIVYVFDQHASKGDGITVDFCGHPGHFKSAVLLALTTAPCYPSHSCASPMAPRAPL